jgi:DNA-binding response OmpR family regulator
MKRILLVDDDSTLRKLFGFVLRHNGFVVEEAGNGLEGLQKLDGEPFDLMIVDVMMPMLDGIGFLTIVRQERGIKTPVLVLTAMDRSAAEDEIFAAGADDVALKPLSHTDLLQRVSALLALDRSVI